MPDHYTRYMRFPSLNRLDTLMTRLLPTFQALLDALESVGLARKPTTQQIQRLCERFVEMVEGITGQRVTVWIGEIPIGRSSCNDAFGQTKKSRS